MKRISLTMFLCMFCTAAWAETAGEDLGLFFEETDLVGIASKHMQTRAKAPATVSVISGKEIRNSGARDLFDVLKRELGWSAANMGVNGQRSFEVRGSKRDLFTPYMLMVDGHSFNDDLTGTPSELIENISLDNIKRIEIIRGPGSALYGSGAFVGVVNVITKNGGDLNGASVAAGRGTYDTHHYNVQAGKQYREGDVAMQLDFYDSDGARLYVAQDKFGQSGKTDFDHKKFDAQFKASYQDWSFNSRYLSVDRGPYIGVIGVLNDDSRLQVAQYFAELAYQKKYGETVLKGKAYLDYGKSNRYEMLSETTYPLLLASLGRPAPNPPTSIIGNPWHKMRSHGAEVQLDVPLPDQHLATLGLLKEKRALTGIKHFTNFDARLFVNGAFNSSFINPSYGMMNVTDSANWLADKTKRDIWAAYLQDVWSVTNALDLTLGVRHDDYSDVGGTTNPRAAAVWQISENWDMKAMYGEAFRAPSFAELYLINNPSFLGDATLKPEEMTTKELSLGHAFDARGKARLTYFDNRIKNTIKLQQAVVNGLLLQQWANIGTSKTQGLELEYEQKFDAGHSLYGNLTFQDAVDLQTHTPAADVAKRKANLGANLVLGEHINLNANVNGISNKPRAPGDARQPVAGHALVDMAVIARDYYAKGLELRLAVFNLLDKTYVDPSSIVPSDFPREGRNLMLELRYSM